MRKDERWVKIGGICGIIAFFIYGSAILSNIVLPGHGAKTTEGYLTAVGTAHNGTLMMIGHFLVAGFGMLGIVALLGLYQLLTSQRSSLTVTIATIYGCIAFSFVAAMVIVQGTVMAWMGARFVNSNETEQNSVVTMYRSLRSIDLGLDLVWDVFICISLILFGISMLRSRHFGPLFGIAGIVIGIALLILNLITAPNPPGSAGLVDLGPFAGLWFMAVSIKMLRVAKFFIGNRAVDISASLPAPPGVGPRS